jgi:hypothetical protein
MCALLIKASFILFGYYLAGMTMSINGCTHMKVIYNMYHFGYCPLPQPPLPKKPPGVYSI